MREERVLMMSNDSFLSFLSLTSLKCSDIISYGNPHPSKAFEEGYLTLSKDIKLKAALLLHCET